jgi:hypothetical protein
MQSEVVFDDFIHSGIKLRDCERLVHRSVHALRLCSRASLTAIADKTDAIT